MDEPLFNELLESVKQADQIMTDHAELRRLAGEARASSESDWFVVNGLGEVRDGEDNFICDTCEDDPILAGFIAIANPKTTLALLDEIDRLKAENDALREALSQISNASCSDARSVVIARTVLTKGTTK
ncbi:ead/Ea22-like family protein [Pseudomonas aeruginosa]